MVRPAASGRDPNSPTIEILRYVSNENEGTSLDAIRLMAVTGAGIAILPIQYGVKRANHLQRISSPGQIDLWSEAMRGLPVDRIASPRSNRYFCFSKKAEVHDNAKSLKSGSAATCAHS